MNSLLNPDINNDVDENAPKNLYDVLEESDNLNCLELLNIFIEKYNQKNRSAKSMFDGIDVKDPTSTNSMMEEFYEHLTTHNELSNLNDTYIRVFDQETFEMPDIDYYAYALVVNGDNIKYISMSYVSLLVISLQLQDTVKNWNIVKL